MVRPFDYTTIFKYNKLIIKRKLVHFVRGVYKPRNREIVRGIYSINLELLWAKHKVLLFISS